MFFNKLGKGNCKQMGSTRSGSSVTAEWSPCGRYLLTATTAPRLRVDNNVRVFNYVGECSTQPWPDITMVKSNHVACVLEGMLMYGLSKTAQEGCGKVLRLSPRSCQALSIAVSVQCPDLSSRIQSTLTACLQASLVNKVLGKFKRCTHRACVLPGRCVLLPPCPDPPLQVRSCVSVRLTSCLRPAGSLHHQALPTRTDHPHQSDWQQQQPAATARRGLEGQQEVLLGGLRGSPRGLTGTGFEGRTGVSWLVCPCMPVLLCAVCLLGGKLYILLGGKLYRGDV